MKYRGIKKIHEGKFITRYDIDYLTEEGRTKTYEMISRNRNIESLEDLQNKKADSVVMILTDESGERILVPGHLKHPNGRKDPLSVGRFTCEAENRVADFTIGFPSVFPGCKYKRPLFSHRASEDHDGEENRQYDAKRRCDGLYFTFCFQLQR